MDFDLKATLLRVLFFFFFFFYDLSHLAKHIIKTSLTKKGSSKNRGSKIQAWLVMGACECGTGSAKGRTRCKSCADIGSHSSGMCIIRG